MSAAQVVDRKLGLGNPMALTRCSQGERNRSRADRQELRPVLLIFECVLARPQHLGTCPDPNRGR